MDYLFVSLMLWGKEQGYQCIDLGMAPLSGLESRPFAPLWHRIGAVIFQHGEHFIILRACASINKNSIRPGSLVTLPVPVVF
jgi:phosphatidylglycerol lysyltransferase